MPSNTVSQRARDLMHRFGVAVEDDKHISRAHYAQMLLKRIGCTVGDSVPVTRAILSDSELARRLEQRNYTEADLSDARALLRDEDNLEIELTSTELPDRIWELMGSMGLRIDHLPTTSPELGRMLHNNYVSAEDFAELKAGLTKAGMLDA